ncbi:hypothetical protein K6L10_12555, partial [Vibrio parahaemolyticus]
VFGGNLSLDNVAAIAAFWGALTGTCALIIQVLNFRKDRVAIRATPRMYYSMGIIDGHDETVEKIAFDVSIANLGRRVAYIESISFYPQKPDRNESFHVSLFDAENRSDLIEIKEGEKYYFRNDDDYRELSEMLGEFGVLEIRLTSGKISKTQFKVTKFSQIPRKNT